MRRAVAEWLGNLRQAAMLALSGFMMMSSLAALGAASRAPIADEIVATPATWKDGSDQLVRPDQRPSPAPASCPGSAAPDDGARGEGEPGQLGRATRSSPLASETDGCSSPTRSTRSDSTSSSTVAASPRRPASRSSRAYSSFAPVA